MDSRPSDRTIIVDYLNSCLKADPELMKQLVTIGRTVTNCEDENPIVCCKNPITGNVEASALGLLNGALQAIGQKPVYAIYDNTDPNNLKLKRFEE
jgi:hypothetical protein